jgi:hypothetical protein
MRLGAMPTEQVTPVSSRTRLRSASPTSAPNYEVAASGHEGAVQVAASIASMFEHQGACPLPRRSFVLA